MSHETAPSSDEPSRTSEAIIHDHNPLRSYLIVFSALLILLLATVLASLLPTTEPWSFLIALAIAVVKATLVILFFMHVKDASRVVWLFCGCSFLWLVIMLALTFSDYVSRVRLAGANVDPPVARAAAAQSVKMGN